MVLDYLFTIMTSATVGAMLSSLFLFLFKSWITERLKNAIKNEYDQKLETHKAQLKAQTDIKIELYKADLQRETQKQIITYSSLYSKQAEVIAIIYRFLVKAINSYQELLPVLESNLGQSEKLLKFGITYKIILKLFDFFDENQIYLPSDLNDSLSGFIKDLRIHAYQSCYYSHESFPIDEKSKDDAIKSIRACWAFLEDHVPNTRKELENSFQFLLYGKNLNDITCMTVAKMLPNTKTKENK